MSLPGLGISVSTGHSTGPGRFSRVFPPAKLGAPALTDDIRQDRSVSPLIVRSERTRSSLKCSHKSGVLSELHGLPYS